MFSPPVYLSVGDEYDKRTPRDNANDNTKSFTVSAKRHPHMTDSTFGRFVSLSSGDPYKSTGFSGPFRAGQQVKSSVEQPPFKPPGCTHKSSGKGDYYGTFSEKCPPKHEAELPPVRIGAQPTPTQRNFVTNPGKKGTYGYTGLTIGQAGEVKYVADPFMSQQKVDALATKKAAAQQMGPPFRAAVRSGGCFDETTHGVSTVYSLTKPLPPKKTANKTQHAAPVKPWVPGGALVKDITKVPEYQEDPYDMKERKIRELMLAERQHKPWHPVGNDPYRHIYTKPINYDPPAL